MQAALCSLLDLGHFGQAIVVGGDAGVVLVLKANDHGVPDTALRSAKRRI